MYNKNETIKPNKTEQKQIALFFLLDETIKQQQQQTKNEFKTLLKF